MRRQCEIETANARNEILSKGERKMIDYLEIIDKIQDIRTENNKSWMDILRIAFTYAPDETFLVFKVILQHDKEINDCWATALDMKDNK